MSKKKAIQPCVTNFQLFLYGLPVRWINAEKKLVALQYEDTGEEEKAVMKGLGFVETEQEGIFKLEKGLLVVYKFMLSDESEAV